MKGSMSNELSVISRRQTRTINFNTKQADLGKTQFLHLLSSIIEFSSNLDEYESRLALSGNNVRCHE